MRNEYKYVLQQGYYQTILFASYRIQQAVKRYNDGKRQWTESTLRWTSYSYIIAFIAPHILLSEESTARNYPYLELTLPLLLECDISPWFDRRDSVAGARDLGDLTLRLDEDVRQCGLWSLVSTRFGYQSGRSSAWYQTSVKAVYPGWRQVSHLLDARSYRERVCMKVVKY